NPTNLLWFGDGSGNTWDSGTTPNWNAGGDLFYGGDYVTFDDSGSAVPDINVAVPVQPGSMTVSNTAKAYIFDGSAISTTGALTKRGNNTLALANDGNNFNGPVSIEAGTLSIGNGGGTGSLGSGSITNNGQLLINKTVALNLNNTITGTGSVRLTSGGAIVNVGGSNSYTGVTTIENGCQFNVVNNNALGATNGGTIVQAGGRVGFTSLGTWTVAEPLEINGYGISATPGALYANTANNVVNMLGPVTVASPSQIRIVNTGVHMTLSNTVTGSQQTLQCTANDTGSILTFQNTLSLGNDPVLAALTKDGVGTMVLAGNSNLCGSVAINNGTLQINTTNTPLLGDVMVNAGTLQIGSGLADGVLPTGAFNLAGAGGKLAINSSNTFVLNTPVTGPGSISLINYGTLVINSSNTFSGGITTGSGTPVPGGAISLFNSYGLGDGTVAKTVRLIHASLQLQGGLDVPAAITLQTSSGNVAGDITHGVTQAIHNLSGTNTIEGAITPTSGAGNSEFAVDSGSLILNGTVSPDQTGRIVILSGTGNGVLNGALNDNGANIPGLNKQGTGKWTLNNNNAYSGTTVVQNGTLVLGASAAIATTPSISIVSNATLDVSAVSGGFVLGAAQTLTGIGHVLGSFNAAGTVSPGPLGTLTFSANLTLAGTTVMELNRTNVQNADLISAATLAYGGTLTVTNIGDDLQVGDTFNLFDGAISGMFAATNLPALSSTNLYWDVSLLNSQGIIKVGGTVATAPVITQLSVSGANFMLQVASQSGFNYVLEATAQLEPA
ncbi:MAG: autotransporter-associated beta strand repeat-containing protein, partial [Verrucomicrobia bacterium]|nr:autotransporter-associated beta strand repeat-containing protein [Verrucomicrobiota bacterium]